jgi:[glutamine synthetase] adenylyltransferase / [glutamine synthetase]-adenylyl-L-tyrosine phosphorylase
MKKITDTIKSSIKSEFGSYPDLDTIFLRLDRLENHIIDLASLVDIQNESELLAIFTLLSLGDAPVNIILTNPEYLEKILKKESSFHSETGANLSLSKFKKVTWLNIALNERLGKFNFENASLKYSKLADEISGRAFVEIGFDKPPLALFAMGKWGGLELNASSDIDPVFFCDNTLDPGEGDAIVRKWSNRIVGDKEGEIYPVDLRLRPEGSSGPLVSNIHEAERYFFQRAAAWERIAYLRARRVTGSLPEWFDKLITHFLFGPTTNPGKRIQEVSRGLAAIHKSAKQRDIKRAPGGIRDIEFLVASFQLSEGRRFKELRSGTVVESLEKLSSIGAINRSETDTLVESYKFVRTIEHIMQVEEDSPQFNLPAPGTLLHKRLAYAMGSNSEEFEKRLARIRKSIIEIISKHLILDPDKTGQIHFVDPQADQTFDKSAVPEKFLQPKILQIVQRLTGPWGSLHRLCNPEILSTHPDLYEALLRLESSITAYGGADQWSRIFAGSPKSLESVSKILIHGRRIVDEANISPYLWEKIGYKNWDKPSVNADKIKLKEYLGNLIFHLGERFIDGQLSQSLLTKEWSKAIDTVIDKIGSNKFDSFKPGIALLAMGKWGGCELAPDGDLDIMLISDNGDAANVGEAIKFGTQWIQDASLNGSLMLDPRLRPEGSGAPMVITLDRLNDYLSDRAAPWEKMALTRSRYICGNRDVGEKAMDIIQNFATKRADQKELGLIDKARRKAAGSAKSKSKVVRIKKALGGMMDFEFAATFGGWFYNFKTGNWWNSPIAERLTSIAEVSKDPLWQKAAEDYLELRRWEIVQLFGSGHRRGDVAFKGVEAERFALAADIPLEKLEDRWRSIARCGRKVYETGINLLTQK